MDLELGDWDGLDDAARLAIVEAVIPRLPSGFAHSRLDGFTLGSASSFERHLDYWLSPARRVYPL